MSTPPLFFVDHLAADQVRLDGDEGRHAARVKRLTVGERVRIADGLGALATCVVTAVGVDVVDLEVVERSHVEASDPELVVVQALPKGDRAELAVELLTELGVDEIVPWAATRSITQWQGERGEKALAKWRRTAREAAKQSRRPRTPTVTDLASTQDVAVLLNGSCGLVLHESASTGLTGVDLPTTGRIVVVVGPEGGIHDDELDQFSDAGAVAVRLGDPVLRTSTAGTAALAVLSARLGRFA